MIVNDKTAEHNCRPKENQEVLDRSAIAEASGLFLDIHWRCDVCHQLWHVRGSRGLLGAYRVEEYGLLLSICLAGILVMFLVAMAVSMVAA